MGAIREIELLADDGVEVGISSNVFPHVVLRDVDDCEQVLISIDGAKQLYVWLRRHGFGDEPSA